MVHDDVPISSAPGGGSGGSTNPPQGDDAATTTPSELETLRKAGLNKKLQFMTHLMRTLDMIVFVEMCVLYYMECSLPRLLLRLIPHYHFLTPKSESFMRFMPAHRPHVAAVVGPNIVCLLLHFILALPTAGEATRGYMHGGTMIDFIGQKAPSSKLQLVVIDLVLLVVQCLMLAVHQEREALRKDVYPAATRSLPVNSTGGRILGVPERDLDAEERAVGETDEIEMRTLTTDGEEEGTRLLEGSSSRRTAEVDLMGVLRSGNAVLANFHLLHTMRTVGNDYERAAAYSLQTIGYTATLAARAAERRRATEQRR